MQPGLPYNIWDKIHEGFCCETLNVYVYMQKASRNSADMQSVLDFIQNFPVYVPTTKKLPLIFHPSLIKLHQKITC